MPDKPFHGDNTGSNPVGGRQHLRSLQFSALRKFGDASLEAGGAAGQRNCIPSVLEKGGCVQSFAWYPPTKPWLNWPCSSEYNYSPASPMQNSLSSRRTLCPERMRAARWYSVKETRVRVCMSCTQATCEFSRVRLAAASRYFPSMGLEARLRSFQCSTVETILLRRRR